MKVYVVEQGDYSDRHIVGITETLEEAEKIRDLIYDSKYTNRYLAPSIAVTEYNTRAFKDSRLKFLVTIYDDDKVSAETVNPNCGLYEDYTDTCYTDYGDYVVFARSIEQAVKIARDMEAQRKAEEAGVAL